MNGRILLNDVARGVVHAAVVGAGVALRGVVARQIAGHARGQARLRRRYGIDETTPIRPYGEELARDVEAFASAHPDARFALTSGSTATPKKIAFTRARLRRIKMGSFSVIARLYARHPRWRTGLFVLAGLAVDDSLTTLILDPTRGPRWLEGLVTPARYLADPAIAALVETYGATAVRLWLLVLADPGLVYSTNPSTLALFFTDLHERWPEATRLVRIHHEDPSSIPAAARAVARRVASRGWRQRAGVIAAAPAPIPVERFATGLCGYVCWDGGYVRPFLEQLERFLPSPRFTRVPMYSMSTETVETLTWFDGDEARFLPIAPGVYYEFLDEDADDLPVNLRAARELQPGRTYAMVVSDPYGLRRYQTDDLFRCVHKVGDVPDLRFVRRRGLTWSYTGEKLTDAHLAEAFAALRGDHAVLARAGVQLACVPTSPPEARVPGYRLVLAHPTREPPAGLDPTAIADAFDRALGVANHEFAAKLGSGRLAPTRPHLVAYDEIARVLDPRAAGDAAGRAWDGQFKLMPLYRRSWEDLGLDGGSGRASGSR